MTVTANMGLTSWTSSSDPYSHSQLSANWTAVDLHNHTSGKGVQIPTGGIADGAITSVKLAANAVSSTNIADGGVELVDLSASLINRIQPLGAVISWWRPSIGQAVPTGWVLPFGQQLGPTEHSFVGGGTITLPDLTNRFILGASASDVSGAPATGSGASTPPALGANGGGNTINLNHTHTVSHNHGGVSGSTAPTAAAGSGFNTSTSAPSTNTAGDHQHLFWDGDEYQQPHQRGSGIRLTAAAQFGWAQTLYIPELNANTSPFQTDDVQAPMQVTGNHTHVVDPHSHAVPGHTHPVAGHTHTIATDAPTSSVPSPSYTAVDHRPAFVGLLFLMKVKL